MPNITQYTAENTKLNEAGFESTARRIGAFGSQEAAAVGGAASIITGNLPHAAGMLGQAVEQHIDYMDRGRVASAATAGLAKLQQDWQQTLKGTPDPNNPGKFINAADPNDQQVMARFQRDHVEPFLTDLQSIPIGMNGGRYAQAKADELRQHLSTQFQADMSHLAGDAAVLNSTRVTNNLAASVSTDPSFHNVDFALKQSSDDMATHFSGANITAEQESRLKIHQQDLETKIVHTAAASAIMQSGDPERTAQSFIKKYPDYIKPDEAIQLAKQARSQIKFNESMDRAAQTQQREMQKEAAKDVGNQLQASLIDPETGGHIPAGPGYFKGVQKFMQMKGADPAQGRALFEFGEKHDGTDHTYTEPETGRAAANGVLDGTVNITDLMKMHNDNKLSDKEYTQNVNNLRLVKDLGEHEAQFKATMAAAEQLTIDKTAGPDPLGASVYAKFSAAFLPEYVNAQKTKTLPPNALDMTDPKSMIRQRLDPMLKTVGDRTIVTNFLAATSTKPEDHGDSLFSRAMTWYNSKFGHGIEVKDEEDLKKRNLPPGTKVWYNGQTGYVK